MTKTTRYVIEGGSGREMRLETADYLQGLRGRLRHGLFAYVEVSVETVNVNSAGEDRLQRIILGRPYAGPEDLWSKVPGISA